MGLFSRTALSLDKTKGEITNCFTKSIHMLTALKKKINLMLT